MDIVKISMSPHGIAIIVFTVVATCGDLYAQEFGNCSRGQAEAYLDVNNVRARIVNTGGLFYRGEPSVYEVPKDSGVNALYSGALWLAGMRDNKLVAAANLYGANELWAGPLGEDGAIPQDCSEYDRVYKVSKSDIATYEETGVTTDDLTQWPTGLGAPTRDANGQLIDLSNLPLAIRSERRIDLSLGERPAIRGDQSIWWLMNDRGNYHISTDSDPMGIEVSVLAYAAASGIESINNSTLYNYRVFNGTQAPITDAFVGFYIDPDRSDLADNLIGSDTLSGMAYSYNGANYDQGGYGSFPPATGIMFLDGPVVDDDQVDNDRDGITDETGERQRTTTITHFLPGNPATVSPDTALEYYRFLQGRWNGGERMTYGNDGANNRHPVPTNYIYSGNPVASGFWSELNTDNLGTSNTPGRRRYLIASGPFRLGPGESTDFTMAIVWARGEDNLDSITRLRKSAGELRLAYENDFLNNQRFLDEDDHLDGPSESSAVAHNYPEPFSSTTTISYRISDETDVRLVIYDVLGRELHTIVDQIQNGGTHSVTFDGSNYPSGVYFYRIEIGHASATRFMTLVK